SFNDIQLFFFFSSRRRHTRFSRDWSSDVCSSDLANETAVNTPTETPTDHSILFSEFPETSNITFNTLFNFKEGIPNKLHIVDSTLVIHNRRSSNSNFLFYNYNLNSGNLSKGYISSGRGPNEILSSFSRSEERRVG